jgi:AraC family transcriptional regulator
MPSRSRRLPNGRRIGSAVHEVLINPPSSAFGNANAILNARAAQHHESRFTGPLSVKAVIDGRATWETAEGRFEMMPGAVLLLNDGEEYSVSVDALQPVETFCFFFERGFVEDAFRATTSASAELLDSDRAPRVVFHERLHFDSGLVDEVMLAHRSLGSSVPRFLGEAPYARGTEDPRDRLSAAFHNLALALVRKHGDVRARIAGLPPLRAATREELARRVGIATSYLHGNSTRGVTLREAARAACLSPFHFHRLFTQFHGITPHRYLTRLRLERARALLRASAASVLDVALDCGFESLGSFATLYKRTFGVTPGAERRRPGGWSGGVPPPLGAETAPVQPARTPALRNWQEPRNAQPPGGTTMQS